MNVIHSHRVVSAFQNEMSEDSLDYYRNAGCMAVHTQNNPVNGFLSRLDESDVGKLYINGDEVLYSHLGDSVLNVTDGHHRCTVAAEQGVNVWWEKDLTCEV